MRDPYEISIWQDVWDKNEKTYVEEKIAIILSHRPTLSHHNSCCFPAAKKGPCPLKRLIPHEGCR